MFLIFRPELSGDRTALSDDEWQHARARRLVPGAVIHVGDGRALRRTGALGDDGRTVVFQRAADTLSGFVEETRTEPERILCTAIPSGGRWDWLLQKTVEVGVTRVVPVVFEHSERTAIGRRPERIVVAAAAQAQRFRLATVDAPVPCSRLRDHLADADPDAVFVFDPAAPDALRAADVSSAQRPVLIVGPEGGFSHKEQSLFLEAGYRPRRLGGSVLRVETAAIVALGRFLEEGNDEILS